MEIIELFEKLAKVPSPSMHEEKVIETIKELLSGLDYINLKQDETGNLIIKVRGTNKDKLPLILSSHMDVVGDDSAVNIVHNGEFIETDKKRTLGADDKTGVACAIKLLSEINTLNIDHGGLEVVLTRDEEHSMTGISNFDFNNLDGEDILVMDSEKLGNFEISGAGYTKMTLKVTTPYGGHSGNDIGDKTRLNAAKLIAEAIYEIPQGVYKENELGVITSINLGSIVAGGVDNSIYEAVDKHVEKQDAAEFACFNSTSNQINTKAFAHYSIRSSDVDFEAELTLKIKNIISKLNQKYNELAHFEVKFEEHLPIFKKADNNKTSEIAKRAGQNIGIEIYVKSFHAGAETHIYANKKNSKGVKFRPYLVGVADIYNMHSQFEKVNAQSLKKGYDFIKEFFIEYNK